MSMVSTLYHAISGVRSYSAYGVTGLGCRITGNMCLRVEV